MRIVIVAAFLLAAAFASVGGAQANGIQGHITSLDPILQKLIQVRLKAEGFDPGPIDGDFGDRSRRALIQYRTAMNILESTEDMQGIEDVLTPLLAKTLLCIVIVPGENGIELDDDEQIAVLRLLGLLPSADYWREYGVFPDQPVSATPPQNLPDGCV